MSPDSGSTSVTTAKLLADRAREAMAAAAQNPTSQTSSKKKAEREKQKQKKLQKKQSSTKSPISSSVHTPASNVSHQSEKSQKDTISSTQNTTNPFFAKVSNSKSKSIPKLPDNSQADSSTQSKSTLAKSKKEKPPLKTAKTPLNAILLKEIKNLGGSKYDLDLVADVDDSDADGDVIQEDLEKPGRYFDDTQLAKELQAFMTTTLKLDSKRSVVPSAPEEDGEEILSEFETDDDANTAVVNGLDHKIGDDENDNDSDNSNEDLAPSIQPERPATSMKTPEQKQPTNEETTARITALLSSKILDASTAATSASHTLDKKIKLLVHPTPLWHLVELSPIAPPPTIYSANDEALIIKMYERAKALYDEEVAKYDKAKFQSGSDRNFMRTVLRTGTTNDKISALTLLIQESPLHTLQYLRDHILKGMAQKKSRRDAIVAVDVMKDLFVGGVLPDRKLKYFRDQGVLSEGVGPIHLVVWYFEDCLKKLYFDFLQLIEELSKDPLTHVKSKSLTYLSALLASKPEQESSLLSLLVNKLGDASSVLSFKAAHLLQSEILAAHPNMKLVVIREIERLLARSSGARARYAALSFLSQIVLRRGDTDVPAAQALVEIYFGMFEKIVNGLGHNGANDVKKSLTGGKKKKRKGTGKMRGFKSGNMRRSVKRPVSAEEAEKSGEGIVGDSEDEADAEAARIAVVTKGGLASGNDGQKQYYEEQVVDGIDAKTMAVLLTGVNRVFPYAQMDEAVFDKHMDTLFKISHLGSFNICIQALTLIFQTISDRFYSSLYDTLIDSRLPSCSKHPMYLNLLHRSIKSDTSLTRSRAFVKRIVQACGMNQTPFICGALFLIGDIMKAKPGLWSLVTLAEDGAGEDGGIERFDDFDEDGNKVGHESTDQSKKGDESNEAKKYDGKKRNPLYSNADLSCLWELTSFSTHFHPTVSLYATTLLSGNSIIVPESATAYDPLQNHTLARFLDRFVYKNPKKVISAYRGTSLMQARPPGMGGGAYDTETGTVAANLIAGGRKRGVVVAEESVAGEISAANVAMDDEPVNSKAFLRRRREDVPVDELFFYDYFMDQATAAKTKSKKKGAKKNEEVDVNNDDDDEAANSVTGSDMDEDEVWSAMQRASFTDNGPSDDDDDDDEDSGEDVEDEDDDFDMEAALSEADAAHTRRKAADSDNEDHDDSIEELNDSDFDDVDDDDGFENIDDEEENTLKKPQKKVLTQKKPDPANNDDSDEDGLIGEDADEELASMFNDEDDEGEDENEFESESESDSGKEKRNAAGQKVSKPHTGKRAQSIAETAKRLGYRGDYFDAILGKKKKAPKQKSDEDSGGIGEFASMDDFQSLIENNDDEDVGASFGSAQPQFGFANKRRSVKRKTGDSKQQHQSQGNNTAKKFKRR
ncbi:hypothetical protein HK100_008000 [Physocladia obscura]|uniref:CCAAT-binding factor domain-containing protein n=1 Tax=Physocladia obscura TaxID=109957 RepID=A0AAD5XI37_9FUNG|nr:hypothetical protein HK100_008000 [Physocladia obscura]